METCEQTLSGGCTILKYTQGEREGEEYVDLEQLTGSQKFKQNVVWMAW